MRQKQPMMIFLLLWTTYFMCYCLRKPLSIYKYYIESEFHLSQSELGWVDVSLLLPYAMVQIFGANFLDSFRSVDLFSYQLIFLPFLVIDDVSYLVGFGSSKNRVSRMS